MERLHEPFEIIVRAEPSVYVKVIDRVVSMRHRLEQGAEIDRVDAEIGKVGYSFFQGSKSRACRLEKVVVTWCAAHPERIDVVKKA